ncbi:MAG: tetratricopeptide repeat protein [Chloroflexota bacterium]
MLATNKTQTIIYVLFLSLLWLLTGCTPPISQQTPAPATQPISAESTPTPTNAPSEEGICEYAVQVRDADTDTPISHAKLTLTYQLDTLLEYTGSEGRYRGQFRCDDEQQRYRLRIEASDYQPYETEFLVREEIETIYLFSTKIGDCSYAITVIDEASLTRIANAKVRVEYGLYRATSYTNSEGDYASQLPCAEERPTITVYVEADNYATYSDDYTLQDEIKEIRLTLIATPTATPTLSPSPTPTLFPPRAEGETLVLVADILVPGCAKNPACTNADPDDVSQRLTSTMRKNLADHPDIRIERLPMFIEEEGGSEKVMALGRSPEFDATFIIWGNYLEAPEVYLFFDIMQTELPFFGSSYDSAYGPSQIMQPSMFEFKADLGEQWANITAFATGLALYQVGDHAGAEPLFNTTAQVLDAPEHLAVDVEMMRTMYFYRGANYLYLGRANLAEPDLTSLYETLDRNQITQHEYGPATLGNLGNVYSDLAKYERAIEFYKQALSIAQEINNRRNEGLILGNLGLVYADLGLLDRAIEYYEQALSIAQKINDRRSESNHLGNLGLAYADLGQVDRAIKLYEQALAIAQEIDDRRGEGDSLGNLGLANLGLGQYHKAIGFYEQALAIAQEVNDRSREGAYLSNLGNTYFSLGEYNRAIEYYEQALAIAQEINDRRGEGARLGGLGLTNLELGDYDKAIEYYERALAIAQEINDRRNEEVHLGNLGNAYFSLGQYNKAIEYYEKTLIIAQEIDDRRGEGSQRGNLGNVYSSLGQYDKAIPLYEQALAIAQEINDRRNEGIWLTNLGIAYSDLGLYEKAIPYFAASFMIATEIQSPDAPLVNQWLGSAYNNACWRASLYGQLEVALPYCEDAVKHAPESFDYRDSRGLAYALLGEVDKAIADFQFAVDVAKALDDSRYKPFIEERQAWIDALKAGENPFTDEMLAELRGE